MISRSMGLAIRERPESVRPFRLPAGAVTSRDQAERREAVLHRGAAGKEFDGTLHRLTPTSDVAVPP